MSVVVVHKRKEKIAPQPLPVEGGGKKEAAVEDDLKNNIGWD